MLYTPQQIDEMRNWLKELTFADVEPEQIDEMNEKAITKAIEVHFEGGIAEFLQCI